MFNKLRKFFIERGVILLVLTLIMLLFIAPNFLIRTTSEDRLKVFAASIQQKCITQPYHQVCYDKEILAVSDSFNLSMEEGFKLAEQIRQRDVSYMNCHVLGHNLASRETKKDLSKWHEVIARCPTNMCDNGCPHGALMERYKAEHLTDSQITGALEDLNQTCRPRNNWKPNENGISMCYHGLGHLAMYMTQADINQAINICKKISLTDNKNYTQTCIEGVFMQIFQPLEPEDFALIKNIAPSKENVAGFCSRFKDEPYHACNRESWAYKREQILTPEGLIQHCSYTQELQYQEKCIGSLMNTITNELVLRENNIDKMAEFCLKLPPIYQKTCFSQSSRRLLQIGPELSDKALNICRLANESSKASGDYCYQLAANYAKSVFDVYSPEYQNYCLKLPQPWQEKCL